MDKETALRLKGELIERFLTPKDPGNANGPRVAKPSARKLTRKRARAARKRNRGAYRG